MSKIDQVHERLSKTIGANFAKPIVLEAVIKNIDVANKTFSIDSPDSQHTISCSTSQSLTTVKENDVIILKSKLELDHSGKMILNVSYFYELEEAKSFQKNLEIYRNLEKNLQKEKVQKLIKQLYQRKAPIYPQKIGLIVFPDSNVEKFQTQFKNKCVGELFIYHLENKIERNIRVALQYFKKYHSIDVICILTDGLTTNTVFELSSRENILYLIKRKQFPYLVSVLDTQEEIIPFSVMLSNYAFTTNDFIEFIHNTQNSMKKQIEDNIIKNIQRMQVNLTKRRNILLDMEIAFAGKRTIGFPPMNDNVQKVEKLRNLLFRQLSQRRTTIGNVEALLMKQIIEETVPSVNVAKN